MIYYFKAMKSLVDTKAKNSLSSYPAPPISEATVVRPSAALSYGTQKRHFDFVDRGCGRK